MEERNEQEQDLPVGEEIVSEPLASQQENAAQEESPDAGTDASDAEIKAEGEVSEAESAPPVPEWQFGGSALVEKGNARSGQKRFFVLFGVIFGICVLLLGLTFFLGSGGIQLVRNITKERIVYVRNDDGTSGLLTPQEAADKVRRSTVTILVTKEGSVGVGSGFVYSADGYICTNAHVVQDIDSIQVVLPDGKAVDAVLKGYNEDADVAVLKIEAEGLVAAEIGCSEDLLVGDEVVAVGTPAKLDYAGTATFGTVSATSRLVQVKDSSGSVAKKMTLIQTDTSVNPGNSGGPIADMYGKVVGMVVMKVSVYGGSTYEGIGFALPIDGVREIVDEIIDKGTFTGRNPITEGRSLIGVTGHGGEAGLWYYVDPSTNKVAESETPQTGYHQMPVSGVWVSGVNGTNAQGKLLEGDVITRINGLNVYSTPGLIEALNRYYAGETVEVTVYRNGETVTVNVMLYEETAS